MNTRLQVEHPVTEMVTGIDLVREQVNIAAGLPISFKQEDLILRGHAVEARVYAEDPFNNFLPGPARLLRYRAPQGPGVRVDDGFEEGLEIPVYYDPMISKLIAYGRDREEAIARLRRAIAGYEIVGPAHNLPFLDFILTHDEFTSGRFDTGFIEKFFTPDMLTVTPDEDEALAAAALAVYMLESAPKQGGVVSSTSAPAPATGGGVSLWRIKRT